jgi:type IV pilus assembly protein PilM
MGWSKAGGGGFKNNSKKPGRMSFSAQLSCDLEVSEDDAMFGKKSKALIGLDIGSSSVKAVELKKTKDGYELVSFGVEPLAQDTVVDGAIMDAPAVAERISSIFDTQKIKLKDVATSVSGHSVIVKRVPMPVMAEDELYDRIQAEASQHIPFDIADVNLSHQLLEATESQMDVLLVAVKKDKILNHTNVLAQAGKSPMVVDIDAFALENCFEVNYDPDPAQVVALLNIGASVMNINIIRGWTPLFTRDVSVGGNQYTDALQKELDLNFDDAERLKMGGTLPGVSEEQRTSILRSVSDILILEIQKTFDFFRATASGENIRRIVVAGGTARVPGLLDLLREEFGMPVEELYPFRKITVNPGKHDEERIREMAPRLAIAVGLALRSFDTP